MLDLIKKSILSIVAILSSIQLIFHDILLPTSCNFQLNLEHKFSLRGRKIDVIRMCNQTFVLNNLGLFAFSISLQSYLILETRVSELLIDQQIAFSIALWMYNLIVGVELYRSSSSLQISKYIRSIFQKNLPSASILDHKTIKSRKSSCTPSYTQPITTIVAMKS